MVSTPNESYNQQKLETFMDTVIYSTSMLQAFISPFGSILITGLLGIASLAAAIFQKKQGKGARIAMGVGSFVLFIFSFATAYATFNTIASGPETVAVRVNEKSIGTSTSDNGGTNTDYILSATAGLVNYDIIVNSHVYDLAQVNNCYQVTFYKYKSLTDSTPDTDMYHRIEAITHIEVADPTACT
jgi:hypothetical protein